MFATSSCMLVSLIVAVHDVAIASFRRSEVFFLLSRSMFFLNCYASVV